MSDENLVKTKTVAQIAEERRAAWEEQLHRELANTFNEIHNGMSGWDAAGGVVRALSCNPLVLLMPELVDEAVKCVIEEAELLTKEDFVEEDYLEDYVKKDDLEDYVKKDELEDDGRGHHWR